MRRALKFPNIDISGGTMEINQEEAELILGAFSIAELETDGSPEMTDLRKRIYIDFPELGKIAEKRKYHDHLWKTVVEANVEVLAIRDRIADLKDCKPAFGSPKFSEWSQKSFTLSNALLEAKDRIFKELLGKEA